jgi:hypothetical protein
MEYSHTIEHGMTTLKLSRREILEALKRQGVYGVSRIKSECHKVERFFEERITSSNCHAIIRGDILVGKYQI